MKLVKNIVWLHWSIFIVPYYLLGQFTPSNTDDNIDFPDIPEERVFIHYNASLLFAGEYLYYKIYNRKEEGEASDISKVAYAELIGEEGEPIFKQKIRLTNGTGQGDFFVPSNIPSGNYKLIGYTEWMKNGDGSNFFQGDLAILNPYQSNQERILAKTDSVITLNTSSITEALKGSGSRSHDNEGFVLEFDKGTYGKRAKVPLKIHSPIKSNIDGVYSLSIRKIDTIKTPHKVTAETFLEQIDKVGKTTRSTVKTPLYLPELRGELVSGEIHSNDISAPLDGVYVSISIPGEQGDILRIASTDTNGSFYFNLEEEYSGNKAIVQVLGDKRHSYSVTLHTDSKTQYPEFNFNRFSITPDMEEMIEQRSVHNQIENGYFSIKPDSLKSSDEIRPFYEDRMITYNLDDYTRFSTVKETLVEVVDLVWSSRVDKDQHVFQIMPNDHDIHWTRELLPLVIVDGVLVQNYDYLLEYNARDIKTISFLRDKYVLGSLIFQGILDVKTIDNDYAFADAGEHKTIVDLFKPETEKEYFFQKYDESDPYANRILDFRHQLLWEPKLDLSEGKNQIVFYTSDVAGEYELVLEGFTSNGNPVSVKRRFMVK